MDITNPDLTKKVLTALNPNKILSEDQFEKQLSLVRMKRPYGETQEESQRTQAIQESQESIDEELKKKGVDVEPSFREKTSRKFGEAATATGKALGTAAQATRRGIGKAANATRRGVGTAATATGKALGTAATATGKALGTAATATKKLFRSTPKPVPINSRTNIQRGLNVNQSDLEEFKRKRRTGKASAPIPTTTTSKKSIGRKITNFFTRKQTNNSSIQPTIV